MLAPYPKPHLNRSAAETSLTAALARRLAEARARIKPTIACAYQQFPAPGNTFGARFGARHTNYLNDRCVFEFAEQETLPISVGSELIGD